MATVLAPAPATPPPQRRFTVDEYHKMLEVGVIRHGDRVELVRGLVVEKPVINPPHAKVIRRTQPRLARLVPPGFVLQCQLPVTLADSEPEPDFAVVKGSDNDYGDGHPGPRDCPFVVEVSDTSLHDDQTGKLELYAAARIPVYWVINIPARLIEVYTLPRAGKSPTYRQRDVYTPGQSVPVVLAGQAVGSIPVSDLLP